MRSMWHTVLTLMAALYALPAAPQAMTDAWRTIARQDSTVALALVTDNHPGASAELGDTAFQARLELARAHVAERLPRVTDYPAYAALMEGLAADFGDGHIWSSAIVGAQRVDTAGIILAREGGRWMVGVQTPVDGEPDLTGASFLGCDGQDADTWATPRIAGFRGDPALEAVRASAAPWLLLDYHNPFLTRPTTCRFVKSGEKPLELRLHWRPTLAQTVRAAVQAAAKPGAAGMKVEPFAGGWWIGLQTLDDSAEKVVQQVAAHQTALRAASTVVIDLRGNGGGNSEFADRIARLLVGDRRFAAAQVALPRCAGSFWRATPGVLTAVQGYARAAQARGDDEAANYYRGIVADLQQAIATGRGFSPELPACARRTRAIDQDAPPGTLPASAMSGRIVLITDRACFSSCLVATSMFRRLGALHVGEATDRSTRYMEVREETLPSGLRTFSTLQKVAVGLGDYGPYTPILPYPGTLGDDVGLKSWIGSDRGLWH